MELFLKLDLREKIGKNLGVLRKNGILPGIIYGYGIEKAIPIQLTYKDFDKVYRDAGESTFVKLEIGNVKYDVLIHDVAMDPVTDKFIHVDFYKVQMDKDIEVNIPIKFVGESDAVKALGGILVKALHELTVKVLPQNLPHNIVVDISPLKTFEDVIRVKNLVLPADVKIMAHNEEDVIISVAAPASEAELAELQAAPTSVDVESVKVETQEKKEKRVSEKEEVKE